MDHYSILDQGTSQAAPETAPGAAIEEFSLPLASAEHGPLRFPGDDGGRSLSAMAKRDLDAALQLLAERAQYITGASGAAIALREGEAMICRASAGPSAPELGAALQVNSGLSGESVRTRKILRCDDAESDTRVNRESCRMLGIASVVVMPLVRDSEVNGVFELLSGRAYAFEERDLTALERLGEMIQTAVEHADAARRAEAELAGETKPAVSLVPELSVEKESTSEVGSEDKKIGTAPVPPPVRSTTPVPEAAPEETPSHNAEASSQETSPEPNLVNPEPPIPAVAAVAEVKPEDIAGGAPTTQKSEALDNQSLREVAAPEAQPQETIPTEAKPSTGQQSEVLVLNEHGNVKACEACGFPVSEGRKLCLDCEASGSPEFLAQFSRPDQNWLRSHLYLIGTLLVAALTVAVLVWSR